jgi:dienelactone hydrolase
MTFEEAPSKYEYPVWRSKKHDGPPILVLHELNGLNPAVLDFCLELECNGWTTYAPALWGDYGWDKLRASLDVLHDSSPRWQLHDRQTSGQVLDDCVAMTRWISRMHGGKRVVVMGNCLTGSFPLALLAESKVKAGILCQPALPMTHPEWLSLLGGCQSIETRRSFGIPDAAFEKTLAVMTRDPSKKLIGFHYAQDWVAPMEKFDRLHAALANHGMGERFRPVVLVPRRFSREPWWHSEPTQVARNLKGPHNTVTSSGSQADRIRMRKLLLQWLEPLKSTR